MQLCKMLTLPDAVFLLPVTNAWCFTAVLMPHAAYMACPTPKQTALKAHASVVKSQLALGSRSRWEDACDGVWPGTWWVLYLQGGAAQL